MGETGAVLVERDNRGIAIVRLNRPAQLNALNAAMFAELRSVSDSLQSDQDVRVIVLAGSGRGFCAGYDLDEAQELAGLSPAEMVARQDLAHACVLALGHLPQPVIAAVNGPAMGGGLCLALATDFRIGSQSAKFSAAFIRLGLSAGDMGCSWLLPRVVGPVMQRNSCSLALRLTPRKQSASARPTGSSPITQALHFRDCQAPGSSPAPSQYDRGRPRTCSAR
jgi:enoyl-CoA hydratase/carnithine racemase